MDLPAGFVLDQQTAGAPTLPEGFVLDGPQQSAPAPKKFGLGDTWPAQIAKSIYSGLTLPGDVLKGEAQLPSAMGVPGSVPFGDPLSAGARVADMAALVSPISPVSRAGGGWAGVLPSPTPGQEAAQAAGRIGVDIPRAAASDSMVVQRTGQALSNIPVGGSSLRKSAEEATTQLGLAADKAGASLTGSEVIPQQAGATARTALERYIGPTTESRSDKLYTAVGSMVNKDVKTPLPATMAKVDEIASRRANAGIAGESGAIKEVMDAATRPDGLNYFGIKDLRTSIGEKLRSGILPSDISQSELKQIYGALSDDLANSVKVSGGDRALAAFERANKYHSLVSGRRENLAKLLNTSDEGLFSKITQLAGSGASADAALLAQARKSIPQDEWAQISAAAIGRLGRDSAGNFSAPLFVRDYGKMSDAGKSILFNSTKDGKDLRRFLDDIYKVSERSKAWNRFSNPSGTAQNAIGVGQLAGFGAAGAKLAAGSLVEPLTAISSVLGAWALSRALARSVTAAPVAQWSRAYEAAVLRPGASTLSTLQIASRNLANTLSDKLGVSINPTDFLRSIQAPARVSAEDQQP